MISADMEKLYPSVKTLIEERIASRIISKDASVYDFSDEARQCAEQFMGWADLARNPHCDIAELMKFADQVVADGINTVIHIGQGGSTQAPMTITKYNKRNHNRVDYKTLDSDSPVRVRELAATCNPAHTLVIIASKSGGTIEPNTMLVAIRDWMKPYLGAQLPKHLVAITDPGSELEAQAKEEGWRAVFNGEPTVGGRFSALSVFGLLPAALIGIDLNEFLAHARKAEEACANNSIDNPAIQLAAFLYDNYLRGCDKFSFLTPKRGRVLGLWIEQLVAESLGKEGKGILPNIEVDPLLLAKKCTDRTVVIYKTQTDIWDENRNFEMSLAYINPEIPCQNYRVDSVYELAEHFVMWEYAIAMCGYLMQVCPFDQPDVASAKAAVLTILNEGMPDPDYTQEFFGTIDMGQVEVRACSDFAGISNLEDTLFALMDSINPQDYFAINAFLPFTGEGRREALESIRHTVAETFGVVSCLEVGPRYMHSTGQLQKGGQDNGVFLVLSANELKDIPLPDTCKADSLGDLAKAQAVGDAVTLSQRGRRVVHLHLPDNAGVTLRMLANVVDSATAAVKLTRMATRH